jgi:hypothetical protein
MVVYSPATAKDAAKIRALIGLKQEQEEPL